MSKTTLKILRIINIKPSCKGKPSKLEIFCDQLLDSGIVGGIAGFSAYIAGGPDATLKVFAIAFGLTFLVKLKEYRGITE
jgi:hypothetical protein